MLMSKILMGALMGFVLFGILPMGVTTHPSDATVMVEESTGAYGSGFFINNQGYLITNYHVAAPIQKAGENAKLIFSDNHIEWAKVIRLDKDNDLALLQVKGAGPDKDYKYLDIYGPDPVKGQQAYLTGWSRKMPQETPINFIKYEPWMTWEYAFTPGVNPGDSGGPITDSQGKLLGVASAKNVKTGTTYAVPAEDVRNFIRGK